MTDDAKTALEIAADKYAETWPVEVYHPHDLALIFEAGASWAMKHSPEVLALVEALEFYRSNDHWFGPQHEDNKRLFAKISSDDCGPVTSQDRLVGGKRAREALATFKENNVK